MNFKKILPVVLLAALLIWGIYDIAHKNNINNDTAGNANISTKAETDKSVEATQV